MRISTLSIASILFAVTIAAVCHGAVSVKKSDKTVHVEADGMATLKPVLLGDALEGRLEVLEGLDPGDVVVVRGNERLRSGQPVIYETRSPAGSARAEPST